MDIEKDLLYKLLGKIERLRIADYDYLTTDIASYNDAVEDARTVIIREIVDLQEAV